MTQSGQVSIYDWSETQVGVLPSGPAPTGTQVRFISENMFVGPVLVDSPEVTPGNEPEEQVQNGFAGNADFQIAFSPRNYDHWLAALMWNDWADIAGSASTPVRTTGAAELTYNPATRTVTTAGSWTNSPVVGDRVLIWGSSNAYLNAPHKVTAFTATTIVLADDGVISDPTRVPAIAVAENWTIVRPQVLDNSLTPGIRSLGFERRTDRTRGTYLGVTATQGVPQTDYSQFYGALPTRIQLQGTGDSPITGQVTFEMAREFNSSESDGSTTVLAGTAPYVSSRIMQGIECVKRCQLQVPDISATPVEQILRLCPQSFQGSIANGLQVTQLMCAQPEKDYQFGEPLAEWQISGIYDSPFSRVAFNQQYDGVFDFAMINTEGEGYLFYFPRARVQAARNDTPGRRQTIIGQFTVKAFKQSGSPAAGDTARAVQIFRFRQP